MNKPFTRIDNIEKANAAWSDAPDWVRVLAEACNAESQVAVAKRLDYSAAVVSQVLSNSYLGDIAGVEQAVRVVLMAETISCPVQGEMLRKTCLDWQKKPFDCTNSHRVRMYQACRRSCPNSALKPQGEDHDA